MHFLTTLTPLLLTAISSVAAMTCTKGTPWTPDEYAEYLTLDDTTDWAPMQRIKHCTIDASELESVDTREAEHPHLVTRGGGNRFVAYSAPNCPANNALVSVQNFGCGGCYTVSNIQSGYLWRQTTGNPYPTVDYYTGPNCSGSKVHHQGIYSGQHSSCDGVPGPNSFVVYQGC